MQYLFYSNTKGRGLDNAKGSLQGNGSYGQGGSYSGGYQNLKPSVTASPSRALSKYSRSKVDQSKEENDYNQK